MKTDLYNTSAEIVGQVTLPANIFGIEFSDLLVSQSIRNFLSNNRSAHAKVKNRAEVAGTTRKMWAQKGTGRARHGSAKAPIFVGGGRAHGPHGDRNFSLKTNKTTKKLVINSILSDFANNKRLLVIDKISSLPSQTKKARELINKLEKQNKILSQSKRIGILVAKISDNTKRAFGNLPGFTILSLQSLNVRDLSLQNYLIISRLAVKKLAQIK